MTALYAPIWIVPRVYPAQRWQWRGHIDTGSALTIAGGKLAHDLLYRHIKETGHHPQYERLISATNHLLTVAPVDALVRVPLSMPLTDPSSADADTLRDNASPTVSIRVAAGIEQETEHSITLKDWGGFDVLVGMDLLSQFRLTIEHGTIQFDPLAPPE